MTSWISFISPFRKDYSLLIQYFSCTTKGGTFSQPGRQIHIPYSPPLLFPFNPDLLPLASPQFESLNNSLFSLIRNPLAARSNSLERGLYILLTINRLVELVGQHPAAGGSCVNDHGVLFVLVSKARCDAVDNRMDICVESCKQWDNEHLDISSNPSATHQRR